MKHRLGLDIRGEEGTWGDEFRRRDARQAAFVFTLPVWGPLLYLALDAVGLL